MEHRRTLPTDLKCLAHSHPFPSIPAHKYCHFAWIKIDAKETRTYYWLTDCSKLLMCRRSVNHLLLGVTVSLELVLQFYATVDQNTYFGRAVRLARIPVFYNGTFLRSSCNLHPYLAAPIKYSLHGRFRLSSSLISTYWPNGG